MGLPGARECLPGPLRLSALFIVRHHCGALPGQLRQRRIGRVIPARLGTKGRSTLAQGVHFEMWPAWSASPDWQRLGVRPRQAPIELERLKQAGSSMTAM